MVAVKWQWCAMCVMASMWCCAADVAYAQCETATLTPADGAAGDQFGTACGIDGDRIIVGSPVHNEIIGAAYIYVRTPTGWMQEAKLTDQQVLPGDDFARTVSISGDFAAVGAAKSDLGGTSIDRGRVFIYSRLGPIWIPEILNTPNGIFAGSEFGTSVSLSGDAVLIGAPYTDEVSNPPNFSGNSGSAYVFRRDGATGHWLQEAKLTADDAEEFDQFGFTVALHGDTAFVTAFGDKDLGISPHNTIGSVYVFRKQGTAWSQVQKLVPSDAAAQALLGPRNFGRSLSTDGMVLLVGERSGQSAYVFRFNGGTWAEEAILKKPLGNRTNDQFANSVAIQGDFAFVGAPVDDDNGLDNSGTVFAFRRVGGLWNNETLVYSDSSLDGSRLGASMAIDHGQLVVGAIEVPSSLSGSVHVFGTAVRDCDVNGLSDECEILSDSGLDVDEDGRLDVCPCATDVDCDDGQDCTMDMCNPVMGGCQHLLVPDTCRIDVYCLPAGFLNPTVRCQQCDPAQSTSTWSSSPNGQVCAPPDSACMEGGICQDGRCVQVPKPPGTPCSSPTSQCTLGGICQANQCVQVPKPFGAPCGNPYASQCDNPDSCNDVGVCRANPKPDFLPCLDNGVFCDGAEWCLQGQCIPSGMNPCADLSTTPICDATTGQCMGCTHDAQCLDDNECTFDRCNQDGSCRNDFANAGAPCGESIDSTCDHSDTCDGLGTCLTNISSAGTPCGSSANTECNLPDTCNGMGTCLTNFLHNGTPCASNGLYCDGEELCQNGACTSSGVNPCAALFPGLVCDEAIDDCRYCVLSGQCSDGNPCTNDVCSPSGLCVYTPSAPGAACGMDPFCDTLRTCAGGQCVGPFPPNGTACATDNDPCTFDTCIGGVCVHVPAEFALPCGPDDCNCNEVYDLCEIEEGSAVDCNANDVPDECDRPVYSLDSGSLSPIGDGVPQVFLASGLPGALGDVTITLSAVADLFSAVEWIDMSINGQFIHRFFVNIGFDCSTTEDVESIRIPAELFNGLLANGTVNILLVTSPWVNAARCAPPSFVRMRLEYPAPGDGDCDGNGVPDECDLSSDPANDCNGNELLDACEIADGTASDCNLSGIPDECELADGRLNDTDPMDGVPDECVLLLCNDFNMESPLNCELDSAQPFDPANPDLLQGWTVFDLNLPPNCPLAGLSPLDFEVNVIPADVTAPVIQQVVPVAGLVRLVLDAPIPPAHWTCFTLVQTGTTQCVAFLPGAVSGGPMVTIGDVLNLFAALWLLDLSTDHHYDVNRSGTLTAEDLITLQDLLNGAGAFDPWLEQTIPSCPTDR